MDAEQHTTSIVIDERILEDGSLSRTRLERVDEALYFDEFGRRRRVGRDMIVTVMRRYGRPLDDGVALTGPRFAIDDGTALRPLRYHAGVDTEARDYTVLVAADTEPLAVMSNQLAAALRFLLRDRDAS